jgi:hypothetical protein
MTRHRITRKISMTACLIIGALSSIQVNAQPPANSNLAYDVKKEVTLNATVSNVLVKPSAGMLMGSHLLLATASGPLDASLGRFGLQGKGALSVSTGQQVEVTGVMKTLIGKQVLLVRTVTVGGQTYTMRNEHGIPVSPQARVRAGQKMAQKGRFL